MIVWRVKRIEAHGLRDFDRDYMSAALAAQVRDDYRTLFPDCRYIACPANVRQAENPRYTA